MKYLLVLSIVLVASCSAFQKPPETVATPQPRQPQTTRINIQNDQGFLEGVLVFGDSLYFVGHAPEAAKEFYRAMIPSESVIPFINELFKVHEASQDTTKVEQ